MRRSISVMIGLACLTLVLACGCQKADETPSDQAGVGGSVSELLSGGNIVEAAEADAPASKKPAKGPSNEELVKGVLATWTAGIKAKDIDKVMSVHSEKFESSEATGKKEQREVLTGYIEMGYLDDAEVNLDGAKIKVEGDKASVTGVGLETAMGTVELEFELRKEWVVTSFEYY